MSIPSPTTMTTIITSATSLVTYTASATFEALPTCIYEPDDGTVAILAVSLGISIMLLFGVSFITWRVTQVFLIKDIICRPKEEQLNFMCGKLVCRGININEPTWSVMKEWIEKHSGTLEK